jgi:hypothetical protein
LLFGLFGKVIPDTEAVVCVFLKGAYITISLSELLDTLAFHATILEVALISSHIRPHHHSSSMHVILRELTFVDFSRVSEIIFTSTMEFSIDKVSLVVGSIKLKTSFTSLLAVHEVASVDDLAFVPHFFAVAVLPVLVPLAIVEGAILIDEDALAVSLAIEPLSLVNISVGMSHTALAIQHLFLGESLIFGPILELDDAKAFPGGFSLVPITLVLTVLVDGLEVVVPTQEFSIGLSPVLVLLLRHQSLPRGQCGPSGFRQICLKIRHYENTYR